MKDFEIWHKCTRLGKHRRSLPNVRQLFLPAIERVGGLPYELAGLLPNREHSRDLIAMIDSLQPNCAGSLSVVGIFAADPFLDCKRVADHLIAGGYGHVANIPPAAGYGWEFLETLDKVGAGQDQEKQNLIQLANRGLSISPAVTSLDHLDAALSWEPSMVWVVPGFDTWQQEPEDRKRLLRLCREVAGQTEVRVILSSCGLGITPEDAHNNGAKGILLDED